MGHQQVYDLCFRARNARIESNIYSVDILDWVKAGVAYNTRGAEISSRKISYFARLYELFTTEGDLSPYTAECKQALKFFYEDLYQIYQDHLKAQLLSSRGKASGQLPSSFELLLIPEFLQVPALFGAVPVKVVDIESYVCENKAAFLNDAESSYVREDTALYRCMALLYDNKKKSDSVLLEVKLWGE